MKIMIKVPAAWATRLKKNPKLQPRFDQYIAGLLKADLQAAGMFPLATAEDRQDSRRGSDLRSSRLGV